MVFHCLPKYQLISKFCPPLEKKVSYIPTIRSFDGGGEPTEINSKNESSFNRCCIFILQH